MKTLPLQLNENKKRLDDQQVTIDGYDDMKKKLQRDADTLQQRVEALTDENDRLNKSKKKMQTEVRTTNSHTQSLIYVLPLLLVSFSLTKTKTKVVVNES